MSIIANYVRPLVAAFRELGNPLEEESNELIALDAKEIAGTAVVETVKS